MRGFNVGAMISLGDMEMALDFINQESEFESAVIKHRDERIAHTKSKDNIPSKDVKVEKVVYMTTSINKVKPIDTDNSVNNEQSTDEILELEKRKEAIRRETEELLQKQKEELDRQAELERQRIEAERLEEEKRRQEARRLEEERSRLEEEKRLAEQRRLQQEQMERERAEIERQRAEAEELKRRNEAAMIEQRNLELANEQKRLELENERLRLANEKAQLELREQQRIAEENRLKQERLAKTKAEQKKTNIEPKKTKPIQKSNNEKVIKSENTEKVKPVDRQVSDLDINKYSGMEIDELYKYVKSFLIKNNVKSSAIDKSILDKNFGAANINKLIMKSYLILLGKKVTIGK